jgi:peptidoglycan-N-acetylglucosamine deacetylase
VLRATLTRFHFTLLAWFIVTGGVCFFTAGSLRWLLATLCCSGAGLCIGLGVSFPQLQMFGPSLCRVDTKRRAIALTFDDGPDPEVTPVVLDCLARHQLQATFFCVGRKVQQYPALARRIISEGHQIENHSYAHSYWTNFYSVRRLREDLGQAQQAVQDAVGARPRFFRPPIGLTNVRIFRAARELGLQVAGYTVRALDRRAEEAGQAIARLRRGLASGAILLLHDSGLSSAKAAAILTQLADELQRSGFECLRLDDLIAIGHKPSIATSDRPPYSLTPES